MYVCVCVCGYVQYIMIINKALFSYYTPIPASCITDGMPLTNIVRRSSGCKLITFPLDVLTILISGILSFIHDLDRDIHKEEII